MSESPYSEMEPLCQKLLSEISPLLDRPYIFFGHSLGSRIAFELLNKIHEHNFRLPDIFIASGSKSPEKERSNKSIYHLPNGEFKEELKRLNGTPQAVLENEELMSIFLPLLRADFRISDKYRYKGDKKFNCKLYVLGGTKDADIPLSCLDGWSNFFDLGAEIFTFAGDHFFIDSHRGDIISFVSSVIVKDYET